MTDDTPQCTPDYLYRLSLCGCRAHAPLADQWTEGYSQGELDDAQARYDLVFPPDMIALYRERRPVRGIHWTLDDAAIRRALKWPLEGLWFDVQHNFLWRDAWGAKPADPADQLAVLSDVVAAAPKLIPILGHRYVPQTPREAGNPVFSVYGSEITYYGSDLVNYFDREFIGAAATPLGGPIRKIRFWSDFT